VLALPCAAVTFTMEPVQDSYVRAWAPDDNYGSAGGTSVAGASAVNGDGRAALLEAIERTGSLSAAARELQIPYRSAWKHVNHMERAYGKKILDRRTGGATGGGCRLTDAGQRLLHG